MISMISKVVAAAAIAAAPSATPTVLRLHVANTLIAAANLLRVELERGPGRPAA